MEREGTPVNEFILDFGLAMLWFEQQGCDAAVIEAESADSMTRPAACRRRLCR